MTDLMQRAAAGFARVSVPDAVRADALHHLQKWWTEVPFEDYRDAIESLVAAGAFDELVDAFRQVLPFGTGGRRGAVGVGPNRMNPFTVGTSVQGHVAWMRARFGDGDLTVVLAYDVRCFDDVRGIYDRDRAQVILGVSSRGLAELAARVYAANGVTCWLLPRDAAYLMSTPELSHVIRALGAHGGLNVSASHNPPDDNGVKVYDRRGAQLIPPDDEGLLEQVAAVVQANVLAWDDAVALGRVRFLGPEHHTAYIRTAALAAPPGPREIALLYTPLHGTGVVADVLRAAGFTCAVHGPQAIPDGRFPTVPGGVANPENPAAMAHALAAAGPAQVVFGTDPDADRIGAEVLHQGAWVHLTGNDIGALVVHGACRRDLGDRKPLVIVTEVSSRLVSRVAKGAGAVVVDDLLVGFKYIAEGLRALEEDGQWKGMEAADVAFVAGVEESHGVLVTDQIRDKDAAGAAVVLAGLAAEAHAADRTLVDVLHDLQRDHGYIRNGQVSVRFEGATGAGRLSTLLDGLRGEPPTQLSGRSVLSVVDHRSETGRLGPFVSNSDQAARNVLIYELSGGVHDDRARVIFRPSGTEPKLKVYVEVQGRPRLDADGRADVDLELKVLMQGLEGQLSS